MCVGAAEWLGAAGAGAWAAGEAVDGGAEAGTEGAAALRCAVAAAGAAFVEVLPCCVAPTPTRSTRVAMPVPSSSFRFVAFEAPGGCC